MKISIVIILSCIFIAAKSSAQTTKHDTLLIQKIDSMFKDDQFWRKEEAKLAKQQPSAYSEEIIQKKWAEADSINQIKAKAIIKKYGYPGFSLVGDWSADFWAIVDHCDDDISFQEQVLALMKIEVAKNNAGKEEYALLTDRVLVNKKQKQIYGTQVRTNPKTHKATPFPLKYPKQVNALRKKMGMEPLEVYLKRFE
jgi:hypothetical protein